MSAYPICTPKELVRILRKLGFEFYRQKGGHQIFVKDERMVVVPMHSKDLKRPTQNNIIKGTGLSQEEFFKNK